MKSFSDLLALHRQLDELFFEHQRALMRLDLHGAATALKTFEDELLNHMRDEEDLMIPTYRERAVAPVGGAADILVSDHDKLRQYLVLFKEAVDKLGDADDLERAALFLIDSQHLFKRLLVHHDTRERKFLYPLLDQITTATERDSVFQKLRMPGMQRRWRRDHDRSLKALRDR